MEGTINLLKFFRLFWNSLKLNFNSLVFFGIYFEIFIFTVDYLNPSEFTIIYLHFLICLELTFNFSIFPWNLWKIPWILWNFSEFNKNSMECTLNSLEFLKITNKTLEVTMNSLECTRNFLDSPQIYCNSLEFVINSLEFFENYLKIDVIPFTALKALGFTLYYFNSWINLEFNINFFNSREFILIYLEFYWIFQNWLEILCNSLSKSWNSHINLRNSPWIIWNLQIKLYNSPWVLWNLQWTRRKSHQKFIRIIHEIFAIHHKFFEILCK